MPDDSKFGKGCGTIGEDTLINWGSFISPIKDSHVIRSFVKSQSTAVVEIHRKLGREAFAQHFDYNLIKGYLLVREQDVLPRNSETLRDPTIFDKFGTKLFIIIIASNLHKRHLFLDVKAGVKQVWYQIEAMNMRNILVPK